MALVNNLIRRIWLSLNNNQYLPLVTFLDGISGVGWGPVDLAQTSNLAGTYDSTAQTLTVTATGALTVDSVAVAVGDRVLLQNQTTGAQKGIYRVTVAGTTGVSAVLVRDNDANASSDWENGKVVSVRKGTANGGKTYVCTFTAPFTLDTTTPSFTATAATVSFASVLAALAAASSAVDFNAQALTGVAGETFTKETAITVKVGDTTTAATAGGALTVAAGKSKTSGTGGALVAAAGAGDTTGTGGAAAVRGGAGGSVSGDGGAAALTGGAGTAGNGNGGAVNIDGGAKNGSGADGLIGIGLNNGSFIKHGKKLQKAATTDTITDPGNAGAIPVTANGVCPMTSAGAETRTLAIPTFIGQELGLIADTFVGNIVITSAQPINQAGNTIMTFGVVNDMIILKAFTIAGALRWRVASNDGVALS